jgi:hypothetical protein
MKKLNFYKKFISFSVGLYHQLKPMENGVTQLLGLVHSELHVPDPLDVHGELGHTVDV